MNQKCFNSKKIIVFHPMQQHSYKTAIAVKEAGYLYEYWTSVYYSPDKFLFKVLSFVLGKSDAKRMKNRINDTLTPYVRTCSTILGLVFILAGKITKSRKVSTKMQAILSDYMGKKVARSAIKNNIDYVIAYDTWAHGIIKELERQSSSIKVIVDFSSLYAEEIVRIIGKDIEQSGTSKEPFAELMEKYKPSYMSLYRTEIDKAHYFLSPSTIVDRSLTTYGVENEQIHRCTYGTYFEKQNYRQKTDCNRTVFIYIGRLSYAKGVHHLIKAFQGIKRDDYKLLLIGNDVDGFKDRINCANIEFVGFIHHDEIPLYLSQADIAISASLFDGFSLSLLESASYNLPIICTYNNGVSDYVVDGVNGYNVEANDEAALQSAILKVLDKKDSIDAMSVMAGNIVEKLTWENYNRDIKIAIKKIILDEGN